MKTIVYAFSGTGNSLYAARKTAEGLECELRYMACDLREKRFKCDAEKVILVFPVYYWGPPRLVKEFIEKADFSEVKYIALMATAASSFGGTCGMVNEWLEKKGKRLNYRCSAFMPSNYIPFFFLKPAEKSARKLELADKKIEFNIENLKAGKENLPNPVPKKARFFYNLWHDKTYNKDKNFYLTKGCTKCGVCARVCPAEDIEIKESGPVWKNKCLQCLACINYCPEKVIQIKRVFSRFSARYHHPSVKTEDLEKQK